PWRHRPRPWPRPELRRRRRGPAWPWSRSRCPTGPRPAKWSPLRSRHDRVPPASSPGRAGGGVDRSRRLSLTPPARCRGHGGGGRTTNPAPPPRGWAAVAAPSPKRRSTSAELAPEDRRPVIAKLGYALPDVVESAVAPRLGGCLREGFRLPPAA